MKRSCLWLVVASVVIAGVADAKPKKHRKKKPKPAPKEEPKQPEPEIEVAPDPVPTPTPPPTEPAPPPAPVTDPEPATKVVATSKPARKHKRFYVRAGVAHVAPLAVSRELELADIDGAASLAVQNGPIAGSGAEVSSATIPALSLGYSLNDRWSLETVLGVPFTVKFRGTGTIADESIAPMALGIPTGVPALGPELGEAKAAPPLLTAVYHTRPGARLRPFFGAGLAVLVAYDAKVTNPILTEVAQPDMSIAPAPGVVVQTGLEASLFSSVYFRLDVKFIGLMLARATVEHIQVRTPELPLFDTVEVGTAKMSVWVNPLIVQAGLGADF
ncbi:MAG TPA: OmpW family outer membrane protein [Kofleriaceae bacterium]|nr:OmpW family outer membrane protein [Kofleriaceae bacterium]